MYNPYNTGMGVGAPMGVGVGINSGMYRPVAGHVIKIRAAATGMCVTYEGSNLVPRPHMPGNSHQQFRLEPAQAFPGFFKLVSVHHPDRVIRFCPALMPNLQLKQKEPGSPNQAWRIDGGRLHPKNHPNMFISINRMTGKYHVDPQMQAFDIMHVM